MSDFSPSVPISLIQSTPMQSVNRIGLGRRAKVYTPIDDSFLTARKNPNVLQRDYDSQPGRKCTTPVDN